MSITYKVNLRNFCKRQTTAFTTMMIIGAGITYTITDFAKWSGQERSKKDKISFFFKNWNPCILFDHYPANIVGCLLFSIMLKYNVIMYIVTLCLAEVNKTKLDQKLWMSFFTSIIIILTINFINIFSKGLYHNKTDNSIVKLITDHSSPLFLYCLGLSIYIIVLIRVLNKDLSKINKIGLYSNSIITAYGALLATLNIIAGGNKDLLFKNKTYSFIFNIASKLKIPLIFNIPVIFGTWAYFLPEKAGFTLSASSKRENNDIELEINSGKYIEISYRVMLLLFFLMEVIYFGKSSQSKMMSGGHSIKNNISMNSVEEIKTISPLGKYFKLEPYNTFSAPAWVLISSINMVGVLFQEVGKALNKKSTKMTQITSLIYVISFTSMIVNVVPKYITERYKHPLNDEIGNVLAIILMFSKFFFLYNREKDPKQALYLFIYIVCCLLILLKKYTKTGAYISNYIIIILGCFFTKFINNESWYLSLKK